MATFFQQMADNLLAQAQVPTHPPQGQYEIEKSGKPMGQSLSSKFGKRKGFEEPWTHEYYKGGSLG